MKINVYNYTMTSYPHCNTLSANVRSFSSLIRANTTIMTNRNRPRAADNGGIYLPIYLLFT